MPTNNNKQTRREFLSAATAAVGGSLLINSSCTSGQNDKAKQKADSKRKVVRFAHLTDIHLDHNRSAPQRFASLLQNVHSIADKPDLIITGGDNIMGIKATDIETAAQWSLFKQAVSENCSIPIKYCIGNHDVWDVREDNSKTTGDVSDWAKQRPVQELGIPNRYYSFVRGKWRFVILDSTYVVGNGYIPKLDEQQFSWLEDLLRNNNGSYICIISHIPILSAAAFYPYEFEKTGKWILPASTMHLDSRKLKDLFFKYKEVKLCISGHLHLLDCVVYNNVTYICDGAVSGKWWKGKFHETREGCGLFDLYDDGTFNHEYMVSCKMPAN